MLYCPQCHLECQDIQCPGCNQFLRMDPPEIDRRMVDPPVPPGPFEWATALAHWGDVIGALSLARQTLDRIGQDKCKMLYCGPDASIPEFLSAQPWVTDVATMETADYRELHRVATSNPRVDAWWSLVHPSVEIDPSTVWSTHMTAIVGTNYRVEPARCLALPQKRAQWADRAWRKAGLDKQQKLGGKVFMVHPMSTSSAPGSIHWPHWKESIDWLLDQTAHTYVLTGMECEYERESERLINLVGRTPTNMEVLALAEKCDGVITTCNSLALWNVTQGLPGIVWGNGAIRDCGNFFRRFIDRPPNYYIRVEDPMERFLEAVGPFLADPGQFSVTATRHHGTYFLPQTTEVLEARATFRVKQGIVSGTNGDFSAGQIAPEHRINGPASFYIDLGMLEVLEQSPSVSQLIGAL